MEGIMKLTLADMHEKDVWMASFISRSSVVIQNQNLAFSAEQCAQFADEAVKEYRRRVS